MYAYSSSSLHEKNLSNFFPSLANTIKLDRLDPMAQVTSFDSSLQSSHSLSGFRKEVKVLNPCSFLGL